MDTPKLPGVAGKLHWGGRTAPSSPNFGIQKQLWLCAANSLGSDPWACLALLQEILGWSWMTHFQPSFLYGYLYHF